MKQEHQNIILAFLLGVAVTFVAVCMFPSIIIEEISTYHKLEPRMRIIDRGIGIDTLYIYQLK